MVDGRSISIVAAGVPQTPSPSSDDDDDDGAADGRTPAEGGGMGAHQSSSKGHAHFNKTVDDADHGAAYGGDDDDDDGGDDDGHPGGFPHLFPQLGESASSIAHAVSQLRTTFSESVLDVAPPQVST